MNFIKKLSGIISSKAKTMGRKGINSRRAINAYENKDYETMVELLSKMNA